MNWNPWKRIRELELALADRDARLEVAYEAQDDAEGRAWDRAARHWQYQLERESQEKMRYLSQLSQISGLQMPPKIIIPSDIGQMARGRGE